MKENYHLYIECRLDGGSATKKENGGVAPESPDETEGCIKPTTEIATAKAAAYKFFGMSLRLIIRRLRSI